MSGTEHYGKICFHCGYDYAIHHYETMQCPKNGDAMTGCKQEWLKTTFVPLAPEPVEREIMITTHINDGGSAFPEDGNNVNTGNWEICGGMSLRDYFAAKAPKVIPEWFEPVNIPEKPDPCKENTTEWWKVYHRERFFQWRFYYADNMIMERRK